VIVLGIPDIKGLCTRIAGVIIDLNADVLGILEG
jgi:hypothetical protein